MPWDLILASAVYSYTATSWRREASRPGGIGIAWFVGGNASIGSIALLVFIVVKITWWFALLCIAASFAGQLVLIPFLGWTERTVTGLWLGAGLLVLTTAYMLARIL